MAASSTDSSKNWPMSCSRREPSTLRMPTSLARDAARAVARLVKLMPAIISTNSATAENRYTYRTSPLGSSSSWRFECR